MLENPELLPASDNACYLFCIPLGTSRYRVEFMGFGFSGDSQTHLSNVDEEKGFAETATTLNWRLQRFHFRIGSRHSGDSLRSTGYGVEFLHSQLPVENQSTIHLCSAPPQVNSVQPD